MTIQELKEHCQQQCRKHELLSEHYENFTSNNKTYQEHKLVLDIIEQLTQYKELLNYDSIYLIRSLCSLNSAKCKDTECKDCTYNKQFTIQKATMTPYAIKAILDPNNKNWELNFTCFLDEQTAKEKLTLLNNQTATKLTCTKCNHSFLDTETYKWRINHRLIHCCPKCKHPIMYAKESL